MKVDIFTDGACSKNGQAGAAASWACWFPEQKDISRADRVPEDELQTNQRGELMAIAKAVEIAEEHFSESLAEVELKIHTDSMYSKNCLTTWLPSWIRNDWKNSQGNTVAHRDLIEDTANRLARFKSYTLTYVKAHTGKDDYASKNNHIVDRMAAKIIEPEMKEVVPVTTNKTVSIEGLPLQLMGPPVTERELTEWCMSNLGKLDKDSLNTALLAALMKTLKKKGFEVTKQRLHRDTLYRLKTDNGLIKEPVVINKEE
jgi:ribonuclease HI